MTDSRLNRLNTLGVPSTAHTVHRVSSLGDLMALAPLARSEGLIVLGGGSNVVLGSRIELPVCLIRNRGIRVEAIDTAVEVSIAAGENWHDLVRWSLAQGYSGLENLALIPGSVGAAPVQNIGAYGVELDSRFVRLIALDVLSGKLITLGKDECEFGYRRSLFKSEPGRFVIGEVTLTLARHSQCLITDYVDLRLELDRMGIAQPSPVSVAEAVVRIRRRKLPDPRVVPNAGSFFKNPIVSRPRYERLRAQHGALKSFPGEGGIKLAAAELIDRCGFKAEMDGPVRVWRRQPLVLTNPGRRPAVEVIAYAERIQQAVERMFDVRLEFEPDIIAC